MQRIRVSGTDLTVSRFCFGTARLHHLASGRDRANLLSAALEQGFTHFDTAPYYGFGLAERALAPLLRGRRELTVATKVGHYPPGGGNQPYPLVLARKVGGKFLPKLSRPIVDWSVAAARDSLTASLMRLKRDHVDVLFLHEPDRELILTDEWLRWLESEKDRVANFGIAGDFSRVALFLQERSPLAALVQTSDSLDRREAEPLLQAKRPLQFTYGYVSAAGSPSSTWSPSELQALLRFALARNSTGAIVVSTRQIGRLAQYAEAAPG